MPRLNKVILWFCESSWICGYDYGPYTDDHWVLEYGGKASGRGQEEDGFRCICSCRAAAPGAGRCVCATRGEGCGCSELRWEAAGGSARTRSGQSFHKTPEERATTYMRCRTQDVTCQIQSKPFSFCNKAAGASQSRILSPETLHQLSLSMRMTNCWPSND